RRTVPTRGISIDSPVWAPPRAPSEHRARQPASGVPPGAVRRIDAGLLQGFLHVAVRVGGEARHAWQPAEVEPPARPVEGDGGVAGGGLAHPTDRVRDDGLGSVADADVVDVDALADVAQLHRSDVGDDRSEV